MSDRDMLKQLYVKLFLILSSEAAAGLFFFEDFRDVQKLWDIRDMRIISHGVSIAVRVNLADMAVRKWCRPHL
ncbi:CPBP family intramembrane metalloprotease, partial [Bacillus vallismortis]|nr:CPBP family intramembrane metalloprotease [Bacillus vallismortis]